METKINNKQDVYKHFERIKNRVKTWQANAKENKIIVTMVIFGHEVKEKDIYIFKNAQYYNLFVGLLIDYEIEKEYY